MVIQRIDIIMMIIKYLFKIFIYYMKKKKCTIKKRRFPPYTKKLEKYSRLITDASYPEHKLYSQLKKHFLRISDIKKIKKGKSIKVMKPQSYSKVILLDNKNMMFPDDTELGLFYSNKGYAVSGSGMDPWIKVSSQLDTLIKNNISLKKKTIKKGGSQSLGRPCPKISKKSKKKPKKGKNKDNLCPICMDDINGLVIKCNHGHQFCKECIKRWANQNPRPCKCPICRNEIVLSDDNPPLDIESYYSPIYTPIYTQLSNYFFPQRTVPHTAVLSPRRERR